MQLPQQFDSRLVDPTPTMGAQLPVSDAMGHLVIIAKSEVKATKDNTGGYVEFMLQLIDQNSPHRGKEGAYRLNLYNSSQQAVEIAYKQLSQLCHVTGVYVVQHTEQLHNIPFRVIVGPQKDPQYTEVKAVLDVNGNAPGKQVQAAPPQPAAAQGGQPAPWGGQPAGAPAANAPPAWGAPPPANAKAPQSAPPPAWGGQPAPQPASAPAPAWGGQQTGAPQPGYAPPQPATAPQPQWQPPGNAQPPQQGGQAAPWGAR